MLYGSMYTPINDQHARESVYRIERMPKHRPWKWYFYALCNSMIGEGGLESSSFFVFIYVYKEEWSGLQ